MSRPSVGTDGPGPHEADTRVLHCARVATPTEVLAPARVTIRDGWIASVDPGPAPSTGPVERVEGWVLPGFVDIHCHGGGGFDYATTDPEAALRARDFHLACGTTSTVASLVTADLDVLRAQLRALAPLVHAGELAGLHLEGPFLAPARCGAHDPSALRTPTPAVIDQLLDAADGALTALTIAPELPGALAAISELVTAGVRVAVGHTDADETTVRRAVDAGASVVTHLFNAMRRVHHRKPGPIPYLLTESRVTVELIDDGVHVHPDVLTLALQAAGPHRVALVTDALAAAGTEGGSHHLGGRQVVLTEGQARLLTADGTPGALAGSTLTMAAAVGRAVRRGHLVPDVARMAATTPAAAYGFAGVGAIEAGRRADLCVLDDDGTLRRVLRAGHWVDRPRPA